MIEKLLSSAKALIKSGNINLNSVGNFLLEFKWEILLTIFLSVIFNFFLFWLLRRNFKEIRANLLSAINRPSIKIDKNDYILSISSAIFFTLITYRNVLSKFASNVIGFPGDSYNHFARLKESKDLLLNQERSYYHWDTIFYPQGLSAFDGDITYYIDSIHFVLSSFFNSELIFNLIMVTSYILGFVFTYLLTRELNQKKLTSLLTAYLVTFSNFHFFSSGLWINLVNFQYIPLFFLFFTKYLKKNQIKHLISACIAMTLIATSSLIFFFITQIILGLIFLILISKKFKKKTFYIFAAPTTIASIVISPWVIKAFSAPEGLKKYFYYPHTSFTLDLFQSMKPSAYQFFSNFFNTTHRQDYYYLGVVVIMLIIYSLLSRKVSKILLFSLVTSLIFCLGNFIKVNGTNLPIITPEVILSFTPVLKSLRATDRYSIFLLFFCGIILGQFFSSLRSKAALLILVFILFLDSHPSFKDSNFHRNKAPDIYSKVAPTNAPILELPLNQPIYWLWQSYHRHPVVYGYVFSRGNKKQLLYSFLKKTYTGKKISLDLLRKNNIKHIILHKNSRETIRNIPPVIKASAKTFVAKTIKQYFSNSDLDHLELTHTSGNRELYKIK